MTLTIQPKSSKETEVSQLLNSYLSRIKEGNPLYSTRAFARDVGLSPAFVSDILKAKKSLPYKHVDKFIRVLDMDQADAVWLKQSYAPEGLVPTNTESRVQKEKTWKLGARGQLKILSKWYYLPMIDLTTCKDFDGDFAQSLGITNEEANEAVAELLKLKVIKEANGIYEKANFHLHFTSSKSKAEFRKYHKLMLQRALSELDNLDEERFQQRLIFGFSLALNSKKTKVFKKNLSDLIYKTVEEMTVEDGCDQIYHLGIQFFPVSKKC